MSTPAVAGAAPPRAPAAGVPATGQGPAQVPRVLRDLGVVLAFGAVEAGVLASSVYDGRAWAAESWLLVVALAAAGVLLGRLPDQDRNGRLLLWAAGLRALTDLSAPVDWAPTFQVAFVAGPLPAVVLAALVLRWPGQRLRPPARRFVLTVAVVLLTGRVLDAVMWDPGWTEYRGPLVWWYVGTPRSLHEDVIRPVTHGLAAVAAVAFLGFLIAHWRAHRRLDRLELLPLAAAATAAALSSGALEVLFVQPDLAPAELVYRVERLALLVLPLSFALVAVAHRSAPRRAAGLVLQVSAGADVTQALRDTLDDPDLQVLYQVDGALITAEGNAPAGPPDGRLVVPLRDVDGAELAVLVSDPALARHPEVLDVAVAAASLGIANARLRAAALAQLAEVQASRRRIAETGMAARRDLERDLHDGAQQRLLAVSAALSRARLSTGPAADAALDETRDELRRAIADLRDLARGVHPALLSQGGLSAAVADLAARSALTVRTDVAPGRWPAAVEATACFLVCEALNNVEKHSPGSRASVSVQPRDGCLRVQVSDDGPGGARPDGHGLRGLTDRASAIGGSARIDSPPGAGTTITVTLPCD